MTTTPHTERFELRLSEYEKSLWEHLAREEGLSVAEWLRQTVNTIHSITPLPDTSRVGIVIEPVSFNVEDRIEELANARVERFRLPTKVLLGWRAYATLMKQGVHETHSQQLEVSPPRRPFIPEHILTPFGKLEFIVDPSREDCVVPLTDNLTDFSDASYQWYEEKYGESLVAPETTEETEGTKP